MQAIHDGLASSLTDSEHRTYTALISHLPNITPSIGRLAGLARKSRRTVMRHLQRFEQLSLIHVDRSQGRRSKYATGDTHSVTSTRDSLDVTTPVTPRMSPEDQQKYKPKGQSLSTRTRHGPEKKKAAPKKKPWPEDLELTPEREHKAREIGVSDPAGVWSCFHDHALTNGRKCIDWDAAWRNWCRKSLEFAASRSPAPSPRSTPAPRPTEPTGKAPQAPNDGEQQALLRHKTYIPDEQHAALLEAGQDPRVVVLRWRTHAYRDYKDNGVRFSSVQEAQAALDRFVQEILSVDREEQPV